MEPIPAGRAERAGDDDMLEAAWSEVEQVAGRCQLERLLDQQELTFTYTMPVYEGLR